MEEIKKDYIFYGGWEVQEYNQHIEACKKQGIEPNKEKTDFVRKYADINTETGEATINYTKIDQLINESACNEEFNHIDYIQEAWRNAGFETSIQEYRQYINKPVKRKRVKTVQEILSDFERLEPKNSFIIFTEEHKKDLVRLENEKYLTSLKATYPVLYDAYIKLSKEEIESTKYNEQEIKKLLIFKKQ